MKIKKILLSLGILAVIGAPITTIVSCSDDDDCEDGEDGEAGGDYE